MTSQLQKDLQLLRSWAPKVLEKGPDASKEDLKEIVQIRARVDSQLLSLVRDGNMEPFIATLQVDPLCAEYCYNLLYLTREEAVSAAGEGGGTLNPVSWYGIHEWAVYPHLADWSDQLFVAHHASELMHALLELMTEERSYVYENFYDPQGRWLTALKEPEVEALCQLILENRNV